MALNSDLHNRIMKDRVIFCNASLHCSNTSKSENGSKHGSMKKFKPAYPYLIKSIKSFLQIYRREYNIYGRERKITVQY